MLTVYYLVCEDVRGCGRKASEDRTRLDGDFVMAT